ncbi:MAG: Veg family protein [Peptostreptococcaceae bacterium]|nr:Veg family protein [Peptostreptococcaceae bacterium]
MATKQTLDGIRKTIEKHLGRDIVLRANKGRKKIVVREGILEDAYPHIFVVRLNGNFNTTTRVSFSYSDVLTSNVKLSLRKTQPTQAM